MSSKLAYQLGKFQVLLGFPDCVDIIVCVFVCVGSEGDSAEEESAQI